MGKPNILYTAFVAQDYFSTPVRKMGMSVKGLGIITEATSVRIGQSLNKISSSAMKVAMSGAEIATGLLAPLGLAVKVAIDFEKEMGNVGTLIDTAKESLDDMSNNVMRMGKRIPKTLQDLSLALYQIRSDGIKAGDGIDQAFGVLESSGKLAVAGLATTAEAAKTVTSAMNVFAEANLNSQQIANSMFKTVQGGKTTMAELGYSFGKNAAIIHSAGVSLYEMNAATAAITSTGITASQAQNELGAAVLALMKPTGNLKEIFENLGYAGEGGFKRLITATGGLVPALEKINATANTLGITMSEDFGRKEALVANILLTGERHAAYYEQLATQMNGIDTLTGKFAEQSAKAAQQMQIFKNNVQELGIKIGTILLPALNKITKAFTPLIDGIGDFVTHHKTISGIVLKGVVIFGLAAAAIAGVALAVGVVTKALWVFKGAAYAYNFVVGASTVGTEAFTAAMLENKAATQGATFAMNGYGIALTRGLVIATALYYVLKGINYLEDKRISKKEWVNRHLPQDIKSKYGVVRGVTGNEVEYNKNGYVQIDENADPGDAARIKQTYNAYDSTMDANAERDKFLQQKNDSLIDANAQSQFEQYRKEDSTYFSNDSTGAKPVGYVPKNDNQNITITLENNSGMTAKVTSNTAQSAKPVPIKIVSTTSRLKPSYS